LSSSGRFIGLLHGLAASVRNLFLIVVAVAAAAAVIDAVIDATVTIAIVECYRIAKQSSSRC
jgi:hypothetical protein